MSADAFYRNSEEREAHEAFWLGWADGVDAGGAHREELREGGKVTANYLDGYSAGFYDRKRQETHSREALGEAVYMASSRKAVRGLGLPWWTNYTRQVA